MNSVQDYVLSVICAAMVCGVLRSLLSKGNYGQIGKLLSGLFLTVSLLYPLSALNLEDLLSSVKLQEELSGQTFAAMGENYSQSLVAARIKKDTQEYILDKAAAMDAAVHVEIMLTDGDIPVPVGVRVMGEVSPAVQQRLEQIIALDLGIAKENQQWIG